MVTETAFAESYSAGYKFVLRFLLRKGASPDLASDVCQSAWARAWEKREQFNGDAKFSSWVCAIAWNLFLADKRRRVIEQLPDNFNTAAPMVNTDSGIDASRVLAMCLPKERQLLIARYIDGLPNKKAAGELGLHPITARVNLLRLTQKIRVKLKKKPIRFVARVDHSPVKFRYAEPMPYFFLKCQTCDECLPNVVTDAEGELLSPDWEIAPVNALTDSLREFHSAHAGHLLTEEVAG